MVNIIKELSQKFVVSTDFVRAILVKHDLLPLIMEVQDVDDFVSAAGSDWKYISYALGTNLRAKSSLNKMFALSRPENTGTALDIGCGYGGFMNAFVDGGFVSHGIEIDSNLAALAELNLKGSSLETTVHVGDLFAGELTLGKFDLITVNDVMEHLPDPYEAFCTLATMLKPGGMLGIYAPNGNSIFYATSDPHNRVFGSSILPGPIAKIYVQLMLNTSNYGLGEYLGLDEFLDLCRRNGLDFLYQSHDGGERPDDAMVYLERFQAAYRDSNFRAKVPPLVARLVETEIWRYVAEYSSSVASTVSGKNYCDFNDHYLTRAWTIVCKKR